MTAITVTATIGKEHYKTDLVYQDMSFLSDEGKENGGEGLGPNPSALLASALASCTAITLRMYADRKEYDVEKIEVNISFSRNDMNGVTNSLFDRKIKIVGNINDENRARLLSIADKCPTHKVLTGKIVINTTIE